MDIEIRHFEQEDIEAIKEIYNQPHAIEGTLQLPYQSFDHWKNRLESIGSNFICLVAEMDGEVVGQLGIHTFDRPRRKHVAMLAIAVSQNVQGKGVADKLMSTAVDLCDNWLNVRRIELQVFVDNSRAISLYKKHGFAEEGVLIDFGFKNGKYVSAFTMARINGQSI